MSPGEALFPAMHEIRTVSGHVAFAVAKQAIADGVAAPRDDDALRAAILDEMWEPRYLRYRPSPGATSREDLLRAARR
jgi:malate dehydrogenase (oxaloacetate-decarboxylating)